MRFNTEQLKMIKNVFELFVVNLDDRKQALMAQSILDQTESCLKYTLSTRLSESKKSRCIELIKAGSKINSDYASYAGDMAMINEYDRLKKESSVIADSIGDIEGQLRADMDAAKRELDVILDRVKEDILNNEEAKSNTEADRKAKVDMRYTTAMEDFRELCRFANTVKNKFKNVVDTRDDLRQSVSTSRNSIIAEGYNK